MSYISIDIKCPDCEYIWDDLVDRKEQDCRFPCPQCKGLNAVKTFSLPNVTRASYVDGNNRFQQMKEAAKLHKEAAGAKQDSKKEIAAEIKKMGVRLTK